MPAYLDAELRGVPLDERGRRMATHLRSCDECGYLYAHMLEQEQAMGLARGRNVEDPLPVPDIADFRRVRSQNRLNEFVVQVARKLLEVMEPAALPDLAYLAEPVLERLRTVPAGAWPGPALGVAGRRRNQPLPVAARFLAATLFASRSLGHNLRAEQVATPPADGRLEYLAREAALRAASDMGFSQPERKRFAEEYARFIAQVGVQLPLLSDEG